MTGNPFANLEAVGEEIHAVPEKPSTTGGTLFYDFETVPDESRFPRPVAIEREDAADVDLNDLVRGNLPEIKKRIDDGLSIGQLNALIAIENQSKKPRKGVLDAAESAMSAGDDEIAAWRKECSVNPFKARICAFGWTQRGDAVHSMTSRTDDEERAILEQFWNLVGRAHRRCGYNILGFDDALAVARSIILDVTPSQRLDRRKYGNREAIDLMTALFPSGSAQKCKDVCKALGIQIPAGDMDGSQVFDLYEAEKMQEIADYVMSDVVIERELHDRLVDFITF